MLGETEVKAQITLRFNTATGAPVVVVRSFQVATHQIAQPQLCDPCMCAVQNTQVFNAKPSSALCEMNTKCAWKGEKASGAQLKYLVNWSQNVAS